MSWFEKIIPSKVKGSSLSSQGNIPEGLWIKCPKCSATLYRTETEKQQFVCSKCGHHLRLTARQRLNFFLDADSGEEIASTLKAIDSLKFKDTKRYTDRLSAAQKQTNEKDAMLAMSGRLKGMPVMATAFDFTFLGGSMGSVVGEKFVRAAEKALAEKTPLVCFSASGGARMQESMHSLTQMAKTSAVLKRMQEKQLPFISVLSDPTMGGVSASLAMLGDVIIAEPEALIGFAGPRVIEQTVREKLPEGFQRSEFLLTHGHIDRIVPRQEMRDTIFSLLSMFMGVRRG